MLHDASRNPKIRTNHDGCHPKGVAVRLDRVGRDEVQHNRQDRQRQAGGGKMGVKKDEHDFSDKL